MTRRQQSSFADLHGDILKKIFICVARSSHGAENIAKTISVCKDFWKYVEDEDVLKAVSFDNLSASGRWELFQQTRGLVSRCAQVGNTHAQLILAKIMLVSSSQLFRNQQETSNNEISNSSSFLEKVSKEMQEEDWMRLFLSKAKYSDFKEMKPFIHHSLRYFVGCKDRDAKNFISTFTKKYSVSRQLRLMMPEVAANVQELCLIAYDTLKQASKRERKSNTLDQHLMKLEASSKKRKKEQHN